MDNKIFKGEMKKLGISYRDIGNAIGLKENSVTSMLRNDKPLPSWGRMALFIIEQIKGN